ncbi:MAG: chemotaxis protein CheW [Actinomycetota bacterium]
MKNLGDDTLQVVVFRVASESYAIPVQDVESIIRHTDVTAVPESPYEVRGVIDIRGRLISIYDLRRRFGLAELEDEATANVLVLRSEVSEVGLMVDSVSEVATVSVNDSQPAPAEATVSNDFLLGVIHHGDALVMLLDVPRLLGLEDQSVADPGLGAYEPSPGAELVNSSV